MVGIQILLSIANMIALSIVTVLFTFTSVFRFSGLFFCLQATKLSEFLQDQYISDFRSSRLYSRMKQVSQWVTKGPFLKTQSQLTQSPLTRH